jgi:dTMP kinase
MAPSPGPRGWSSDMFIVFEGIDGSGKTTLSNRVAKALRQGGLAIEHVREGGKFASLVTQSIRELGRDARHLALTPFSELLLYVAREVQLLEEAISPALARADAVLADRFLYTAEVLARDGRGLPASEVDAVVRAASRDVAPDLVILVDVDPNVARARRRIAKIMTPDPRPSSRKGLAGAGLQHRLREGYLRQAKRDPDRWLVVDNTDADLGRLETMLTELVRTAVIEGAAAAVSRYGRQRTAAPPAREPIPRSGAEALAALLDWTDRRSSTEPALAAYFLSGLWGSDVDQRRRKLAEAAPEVIAHGLQGLTDPVSWELRHTLRGRAPGYVARSLGKLAGEGETARRLREQLCSVVPADVAASLDGRDDQEAWRLRARLYAVAPDAVVGSLRRVGSPRAWQLRDRWLEERGGEAALADPSRARVACRSISGLDEQRAWALRKACCESVPVEAIDSLLGLSSERAWRWREQYLERAPKIVLRTLAGLDEPRAWSLREAVARRCKEALDSMVGLDGARAWRIREECADLWPSTVVKSLGPLALTARGEALVRRQLECHPGNLSLLKHAAALASTQEPISKLAIG